MKIRQLVLTGAAVLLASPLFATTYFGGVEDWNGLDYDYNDVVFSLNSNSLTLNSATGQWYAEPALGTSATPFWNRSSLDAPNDNVGYCIYGGGNCNHGVALGAGYTYLAANNTSKTGSANDVTFSAKDPVTLSVALTITAGYNKLGWYSLSDPNAVHWFTTDASYGSYTFNPDGSFGLVDENLVPYGNHENYNYYSQSDLGSLDQVSHFAFFADPPAAVTPEPAAIGLLGLGLIGAGFLARRQRKAR